MFTFSGFQPHCGKGNPSGPNGQGASNPGIPYSIIVKSAEENTARLKQSHHHLKIYKTKHMLKKIKHLEE